MSDPVAQMRGQESMFNPADMTAKMGRGDVRPDMSIRDFFGQMGIDVDGPISQLASKVPAEMQKASPMNKLRMMGGGSPPSAGAPTPGMPGRKPMVPTPAAPAEPGGMAGLMSRMR